jgi:hypothetical protein
MRCLVLVLTLVCSIASADTYSYAPIYTKGRMNDDASFPHCRDVNVRIAHERIIKDGKLRVDVSYGHRGQMSMTMVENGKDVTRTADEYDHQGMAKFRMHSEKYGHHEMEIFVWPGDGSGRGSNGEDRIWIGVSMFTDGVKCAEIWHGEALRLDRNRP